MSYILSLVLILHNNPQFRYYYYCFCSYSNLTDKDTEAKTFAHSIISGRAMLQTQAS